MIFFTLPAGLTALCLATLVHAADNVCFLPNGAPSSDVPCNPSVPDSMCCSTLTACLASGLCRDVSTNGTSADTDKFVRATCTDPSWTSDVCPQFCRPTSGGNGTIFDLGLTRTDVHIRQCQTQVFGVSPRFCCGFDDETSQCCENPSAIFQLEDQPQSPTVVNPAGGLSPDALSALSASTSTSTSSASISSWATPKKPLVVPSATWCDTPSGQCSSDTATTALSSGDSSAPSTDPPSTVSSPSVSATSTPASRAPATSTYPGGAQAASAIATALANSTSSGSGSSDNANGVGKAVSAEDNDSSVSSDDASLSSMSWRQKPKPILSTVAIAGIGLSASLAAAGLVTILVYILARRRLYMKQKKRWDEQMKALGQDASAPPPGGPMGMGMVAVQTQTADGKPAVVMLTQAQAQQQGMWTLEGPSPVSLRDVKGLGWDARSVSEYSDAESRRLSAGSARRESASMVEMDALVQQQQEKKPVAPKATVDPRGARTVTWFARHSIYEMG